MNSNKKKAVRSPRNCGIIALMIAIPITILFGWIPGAVGLSVGLLAVVLGIITRRKTDKAFGKGGIVMGVIAVVFSACFLTAFLIFPDLISEVAEKKGFSMMAEHTKAMKYGIVGFMIEMDSEKDANYYLQQLDEIKNSANN